MVSDSGIGIHPEFVPYVFERFRQADAGSRRRFGGLGLGLAIVRHLVELHGGSVRAESAGEGNGATFRVTLPSRPGGVMGGREVGEGGGGVGGGGGRGVRACGEGWWWGRVCVLVFEIEREEGEGGGGGRDASDWLCTARSTSGRSTAGFDWQ